MQIIFTQMFSSSLILSVLKCGKRATAAPINGTDVGWYVYSDKPHASEE